MNKDSGGFMGNLVRCIECHQLFKYWSEGELFPVYYELEIKCPYCGQVNGLIFTKGKVRTAPPDKRQRVKNR